MVVRRDLGEDDRELAVRDERDAGIEALPAREAAHARPRLAPPPIFPTSVTTTASATIQPTSPNADTSIESPKTKKKSAAKMSRKLKKRSSICSRTLVSERTMPAISAPIASDSPSSSASAAHRDEEAEHGEQEELERKPVEQAVERLARASATRRGPR